MPQDIESKAHPIRSEDAIQLAFERVRRTMSGIAESAMRGIRDDDLFALRPPLLLCEDEQFLSHTAPLVSASYGEDIRSNMMYEAVSGTIFTSRQVAEEYMRQGKSGELKLGVRILEEYLHAFSSFPEPQDEKQRIRIGFSRYSVTRNWHNLEPGGIYTMVLENTGREQTVMPQEPTDLHLTETITRLAVWQLATSRLIRFRLPQFTHVALIRKGKNRKESDYCITVPVNERILQLALRALVSGKREELVRMFPRSIIGELAKPHVLIYPSKQRIVEEEDLFTEEMMD